MLKLQGYMLKLQGYVLKLQGYMLKLQGYMLKLQGYVLKLQGYMLKLQGRNNKEWIFRSILRNLDPLLLKHRGPLRMTPRWGPQNRWQLDTQNDIPRILKGQNFKKNPGNSCLKRSSTTMSIGEPVDKVFAGQKLSNINHEAAKKPITSSATSWEGHSEQIRFGLVVWIPGIPLWKGLLLRGTSGILNHQPKPPTQTTNLPLAHGVVFTNFTSHTLALEVSGAHLDVPGS